MAFVIFSVGPMTRSGLRTVDALPLATAATVGLLLLMAGCYVLGYRTAHLAATPVTRAPTRLDLDHPEGRALIDRIGALSGRLTQLESVAATLARRLSVTQPSGGPFIPLRSDPGSGLSRLEDELTRLEGNVTHLTDLAVAHDLAGMAFPSRRPVRNGATSSGFGSRRDPFTGRPARHEGLDFPAPSGTPILASAGGRVMAAGPNGAYGNAVVIDHGNGLATLYGHASRLLVQPGDLVMPQQAIATVGSTGRSTGPHLHFEIIRGGVRVEPRDYLARSDTVAGLP